MKPPLPTSCRRSRWRAYVTNAPEPRLSLEKAVRAYRHEYHIEHAFGRLKGAPLSIAPMFVKRDDQVVGLTQRLEPCLARAQHHGVRGSSLVETAGDDSGWTVQGQPTQSHRQTDSRTAHASLCADHADTDAVTWTV